MKSVVYDGKKITPSKVICVGRNYVEHIRELGNEIPSNMVLFNKPNSAISDTLYFIQDDCRFEAEICFLMMDKKIEAIGFGLDLTKASVQNELKSKGLPWERAKGFDNSAVFSEFVKFDGDLESLEMRLFINDKLTQYATFDLMIYKPQEIIDEIESFMSIEDGDIIMSGTPKGVATYKKGDMFRGEVCVGGKVVVKSSFVVQSTS